MPRRRCLRRFPSFRNLQIYHEVAYCRRTQTAVAAELGLSQVRVSQICRQTQAWVDCLVPARYYLGKPGLRFHLAVAYERLRLQHDYGPLLEMFLGDDGQPRFLKRSVTVVSGEPLHTVAVTEQHNYRLLHHFRPRSDRTPAAYAGSVAEAASEVASPAEPLSNCSETPSNPHENRGGGVLNECRPQPSPTAELDSSVEFAAAGPGLFGVQRGGAGTY